MRTLPATAPYNPWPHPSYEVRVRAATAYLWGANGLKLALTLTKPLVLHIRNSEIGEDIVVGTETVAAGAQVIGTLEPGQCVSIPIVQGLTGVTAQCAPDSHESIVACHIQ